MTARIELFFPKTICPSTGRAKVTMTVEERASHAGNNHARFQCYVWFSHCRPDDLERWTVVYTHQESAARSRYAEMERHRCHSRSRHVDHWRMILDWDEREVWQILREF